tara:strand:+ start:123 stop:347 length:225 start_codon:yes stop_codon:yes gene_type:complete
MIKLGGLIDLRPHWLMKPKMTNMYLSVLVDINKRVKRMMKMLLHLKKMIVVNMFQLGTRQRREVILLPRKINLK